MPINAEQIGAAEGVFEKLPLNKKVEAIAALARAERSAAANPYGFPLSSTGICNFLWFMFHLQIQLKAVFSVV